MKNNIDASQVMVFEALSVHSRAFQHNRFIPSRYTCDGSNVNPAIDIDHIPEGTQSLAVIMRDPDAPVGFGVHWLVWNLPVVLHIDENTQAGTTGTNDFGSQTYNGPCSVQDIHRYVFKMYALDTRLELLSAATGTELEQAMQNHIIGFGQLAGVYQRNMWLGNRR